MDTPEAPPLDIPPEMGLDAAAQANRFLIKGEHANLWFEGQGDGLVVSFDNLATIDEGWPRGPWAWKRLEPMGHSVLGVQSHAKDWFRQPTAPALLRALEERGFFRRFRRVVLTGASMGGFAALNFAPLIPEARALAFSPQTTMNKAIAPYEARFPYAVKRSNWEGMPFLDAAAAAPYVRRAVVVYDPFVPEDRAHAARLAGPNVQLVRVPFCTHEAIRVILKTGTFPLLINALIDGDGAGPEFWQAFRGRRAVTKWQRAMLAGAANRGRHGLVIRAADAMLRLGKDLPDEDTLFIRRARRAAANALKAVEAG
ncbi:alpha/beta fold hydrolase, partial [Tabrizicola sp.]|uniref:alpha/beta fold hydrolase n=1 Tax=Tabrizicola sp. TaxID=2005166 RepID=UPI003F3A5752